MNWQTLLNSRGAGRLALFLSRRIPPALGYRLAGIIAARVAASRQTPLVQAIRANQWVVSGGTLSAAQLDQAVEEGLGYVAKAFFELFRYLYDAAKLEELVVFDPQAEQLIHRSSQAERGVLVCGLHTSSFDLAMRSAALRGARILGLSLPEATEAIEWQHEIRRQAGVEILAATIANIRYLIHRLEAGEMVITGVDRPVAALKHRPLFFGRPAHLPTHHIYMAQKARVPIVLLASILQADGRYHVCSSEPIEMEGNADRDMEMMHNAERVLQAAEALIRLAPRQWTVFQPVWPEALREMP
jgi:KDO2-lipid IV(A) lauroyltransferase